MYRYDQSLHDSNFLHEDAINLAWRNKIAFSYVPWIGFSGWKYNGETVNWA